MSRASKSPAQAANFNEDSTPKTFTPQQKAVSDAGGALPALKLPKCNALLVQANPVMLTFTTPQSLITTIHVQASPYAWATGWNLQHNGCLHTT